LTVGTAGMGGVSASGREQDPEEDVCPSSREVSRSEGRSEK